jgi:hypothetical protein
VLGPEAVDTVPTPVVLDVAGDGGPVVTGMCCFGATGCTIIQKSIIQKLYSIT